MRQTNLFVLYRVCKSYETVCIGCTMRTGLDTQLAVLLLAVLAISVHAQDTEALLVSCKLSGCLLCNTLTEVYRLNLLVPALIQNLYCGLSVGSLYLLGHGVCCFITVLQVLYKYLTSVMSVQENGLGPTLASLFDDPALASAFVSTNFGKAASANSTAQVDVANSALAAEIAADPDAAGTVPLNPK